MIGAVAMNENKPTESKVETKTALVQRPMVLKLSQADSSRTNMPCTGVVF
jgi:hypothetical protein